MMTRYGMLIDTTKCVGCYACRTACQRQNNLEPDEDFIRYERAETGTYPNVRVETVPLQCMHCEDAPKTGAVDKCRFCAVQTEKGGSTCTCVDACPTHARIFGDLDDPDSELARAIVEKGAKPIAGDLTRAKVYYVR